MRFRTWQEAETCKEGPMYRVDTIVFDTCIDDDGMSILDAEFWYDEAHRIWTHPFDCFFTDLGEARLWCKAFSPKMVEWTHRMGNGKKFESVAVDIIEMHRECGEWAPGYAVSTYDWLFGVQYEEWHDNDVADKGLECKV